MMFDKFKGIQAEREIKEEKKPNNLEKLIKVGDKIIKKYRRRNHRIRNKVHNDIYADLKKKELEFSQEDLISYIMAKSNQDLEEKDKLSLGHYTGCLLEILTENNEKQGKRTQIYVNGHGNKFENLFFYARNIDELIVDNFQGQDICNCIAAAKGKANSLVIMNCKGHGLGREAAVYSGKIGMILLLNNEGYGAGSGAAYQNGNIKLILAANNTGDTLFQHIGSDEGKIDTALAAGQKGKQIGFLAGNKGKINQFLILDCKGDNQGYFIAREGHVNLLMVANLEGSGVARYMETDTSNYDLRKLVLHNAEEPEHTPAKKTITGKKAELEYEKIKLKQKTDEMVRLAESLSGKNKEEMFEILDKIKETYKSTK